MTNTFRPLQDHVLLSVTKPQTTTASGIVLTAQPSTATSQGIVVAVGPGRILDNGVLIPTDVKVGERVMFEKGTETELTIDGQSFAVVLDGDIIGVLS